VRWKLLPVVALRQAGFPVDLLDGLADPRSQVRAADLRAATARAREVARAMTEKLRGAPELASAGPLVGMLAALPADVPGGQEYRQVQAELAEAWEQFEAGHGQRLRAAQSFVVSRFREDPALREVLLLSNDAHYPRFESWLAEVGDQFGKRERKMTDLLVRYLQRVTTKNETAAHFGPVTTGRVQSGVPGVRWSDDGTGERRVFCAHWAAEEIAATLSRHPGMRPLVRPRRRPLAFSNAGHVNAYAPATTTGFLADWRFEQIADEPVTVAEEWLLERCDGVRTLADLRREWPYSAEDLDETLAGLVARDWVVDRFEIPVGTADPLRALEELLPADAAEARRMVADLAGGLATFGAAEPTARAQALATVKTGFTEATGTAANRGAGRHYADRAIFYEECHSRVRDLTLGPDVERLLAEEMAPVYDLVLAGPRLRMRRERDILAHWMTERFGAGRRVALADFYAGYFADRTALSDQCSEVDNELSRLDERITDVLLAGADPDAAEIVVSEADIAALLAGHPADPVAVCNPDVLLAASSAEHIAAGDFTVVLGECHAVRELLCHSSYAPLLAEREPDLASLTHDAYQSMMDPDEILCDLVRSHPNKTGAQLVFPIPDVEITGRSGKPADQVISPDQLWLMVVDSRVQLRADGVDGRLRPLSVPAGGPSIRQDPLSPLGFPRHFGGVGLRCTNRDHVPRIRHGRVVLRRESWRVPAAALRGGRPIPGTGSGDAADFHAVQELRDTLGLPRHVFAKVPGEPKPLYVDLDAPLLVRQLCRMTRSGNAIVEVSEMLPGPDQLWLDIAGHGHTAELRYAVFSAPVAM
jgi:hypothetical protein